MSMFGGGAMPSLADIAAVTRNNDDGGFGGNNGWWVLIILFALFGGWGNNGNCGNGNNGGGGSGTVIYDTSAGMQRGFDTSQIITKLDGLNSGLCSLGYDQLAQMNGINANIMQTGFGLQQAINNADVNAMRNTWDLSRQQADCCCQEQVAFMNVINQMDKNNCATNTNVHQTGDAIIQNQNQGFQMLNNTIKDGFCNLEMREMQRENADLRQRLNDCNRDSALQGTANYIVNQVRPTPTPSWNVQNPWSGCNNNVANDIAAFQMGYNAAMNNNNNNNNGCCNQNFAA